MKQKNIIAALLLLMCGIVALWPTSGPKAVDIQGSVSFNIQPNVYDIDTLSGRGDTLRIVHYGDTVPVYAVFPSDLLMEFDYIDADTCFRHYFNNLDSITIYLNLLSSRQDPYANPNAQFTSVYYDTLGAELADFHHWIDCVWAKTYPADTLFGPWWTFRLEVLHWDKNATRFNSSVKDSLKWQTTISLMDFPR